MAKGLILTFALLLPTVSAATAVSIQNESLQASLNQATGYLSLTYRPGSVSFLKARLGAEVVTDARVTEISDPVFGNGSQIHIWYRDGRQDKVTLFQGLDLVLITSSLHNDTNVPSVVRNVRPLSGTVDLGVPPSTIKSFGTGGLLPVDRNPGSYAWLALVEPGSSRGVVAGWLTHERGSGVLFSQVVSDRIQLDAQIDYGRLLVAPGMRIWLETLAIGYFEDARAGLELWADVVARYYRIKLPAQPVGYCSWYSRPYGGACDESHLAQLAEFAARHLLPFGFSVIQIDDGWQAGISKDGPKRNFTTHDPTGPYPSGMKAAADKIRSCGLVPGIWFMPFAGTSYDPFFADHQDWFVKRDDGTPYQTRWGGTSLDMTNAGAREYLRSVVDRIAGNWGFGYFKLDGLWTGSGTSLQYVNTGYKDDGIGDAVFYDPNKTNIEAFRDGLRLVRKAAGPSVFILGCNAPQNMRSYGAAFGLVDAMRIGPDNGVAWERLLRGPTFGSRHYFLHGRIWYNDPDPIYVRDSIPLNHARVICSWVTISGQLNMSSEWLPGLSSERLDLLKRTMPSHGLLPRPVDIFEHDPPRIWLLTDTRRADRRDIVGIFNWTEKELLIDRPLARMGLDQDAEYVGFEYWQDRLIDSISGKLTVSIPAQSCMVISLRKRQPWPLVISTSRHITQGIVDIVSEQWDQQRQVLTGRSLLVGGDPYELRIVGGRAIRAEVGPSDGSITVQLRSGAGLDRVLINSPKGGYVDWCIYY